MTTTANGRRKNSKIADFNQAYQQLVQDDPKQELEEPLESDTPLATDTAIPVSDEKVETATPIDGETANPQQTIDRELTAEEILKQAKQQASQKTVENKQEEPTDSGQETAIAPKTASSELQQALGQAASDLITASTQAKQQRIETGILQGYEKAKDIRVGEQLGTLLALTQAETVDVTELTEQLEKLRSHTDAQTADVVSNALKKLGISSEQAPPTSPLESTLSSLPDKDSSFKIL